MRYEDNPQQRKPAKLLSIKGWLNKPAHLHAHSLFVLTGADAMSLWAHLFQSFERFDVIPHK